MHLPPQPPFTATLQLCLIWYSGGHAVTNVLWRFLPLLFCYYLWTLSSCCKWKFNLFASAGFWRQISELGVHVVLDGHIRRHVVQTCYRIFGFTTLADRQSKENAALLHATLQEVCLWYMNMYATAANVVTLERIDFKENIGKSN